MPHFYSKKCNRIELPDDALKEAIAEVNEHGKSIRATAAKYGISKSALQRYVRHGRTFIRQEYSNKHSSKQVFTQNQESCLADYLIHASKLNYGLSKQSAAELAYQFAKQNKLKYPKTWDDNASAGKDWMKGFFCRNSNLSLRKPEATSLSRSTSFNKKNVGDFFTNLEMILKRKHYRPENIWNIDETGSTTVHIPCKIVAQKGAKQVSKITSAERGTTVTLCCGINAIGQSIPPFFIFPRVFFRDFMLKGAPTGSNGAAHPSGWMTSNNFSLYFDHFLQYAKPKDDHPTLLLYDNHESHISIDIINKARNNNVTLLTIPPHCSHKLQPLDVSVYGPFKTYYNSAADSFMLRNPGKPIQIYDIPQIVAAAHPQAFTPSNIVKGFEKTGIYPFNKSIFSDSDFLCSSVTDRPIPTSAGSDSRDKLPTVSSSVTSGEDNSTEFVTPEMIRPHPKAAPRIKKTGRKPGRTRILTDTPEKNEIYTLAQAKQAKKAAKENKQKKQAVKKKICESSDESEGDINNLTQDESDNSNFLEDETEEDLDVDTNYAVGQYVIVQFPRKSSVVHYAGKIMVMISDIEAQIKFLRKTTKCNQFFFPEVDDVSDILIQDIVCRLPPPLENQSSTRMCHFLTFPLNLNIQNMR